MEQTYTTIENRSTPYISNLSSVNRTDAQSTTQADRTGRVPSANRTRCIHRIRSQTLLSWALLQNIDFGHQIDATWYDTAERKV